MRTIKYNINQFVVKVSIPEDVELYKLQAQIPGIEYAKENHLDASDIEFEFVEDKICKIFQHQNKVQLHGVWSDTFKTDFPHLLYGILRNYWIEHGFYPIHSIMLKNSILIGHSGSGKTSLSMEALRQNIDVHSYDKTLVHFTNHQLECIAGTSIISIRKELYNKDSCHYSVVEKKEIQEHGDRVLIFSNNKNLTEKIKNIYLFFIADIPLSIKELSIGSSLHELYPFFLDVVKTDVIIGNGQAIFNGNNTEFSKTALMNKLNCWLLRNNKVEILVGRKEDIIQRVVKNNEKGVE